MNDRQTDIALACALSHYSGDVVLMVPVLRPQARKIAQAYIPAGQEDNFLLSIFDLVDKTSLDPRFGAAFPATGPGAKAVKTITSNGLEQAAKRSSVGVWKSAWVSVRKFFSAMTWRTLWDRIISGRTQSAGCCSTPATEIGPVQPAERDVSEPKVGNVSGFPEANVLGGNRTAGSNGCGITVELVVTCKDGILADSLGCSRGICPYCMGK